MSLVDQIFEQAKLGTAVDPGANPFATGVQLGQKQQQLNMELAQLPLKQTLLQQDAALKAAQVEQILSKRQDEIATQEQLGGLSGQVARAWTETSPKDAIPLLLDALKKTPALANNENYQQLWKNTQTAIAADNLSKYHDTLVNERSFRDKPNAAKFEELAKQAEAAGDPGTAQMYRDHADLEVQKETRLQQQQQDVHQHNQIRLKQLEANIARTNNKAALDALQSKMRNIENAPRLKLTERNQKTEELLKEYEDKYGTSAAPAATSAPAARFTPGTVYKDKFGNQREYQADGTWKALPQ